MYSIYVHAKKTLVIIVLLCKAADINSQDYCDIFTLNTCQKSISIAKVSYQVHMLVEVADKSDGT